MAAQEEAAVSEPPQVTESKHEIANTASETPAQRDRGGRGRGGFQRRNANRSNYESLEESSDATEILRQVEFYFSDSNLPVDEYLLKLTGGHENKPVPLKTIHDFKRMRHFQPFSAVRDAVKTSELLDLSDDNEIIRKIPIDSRYTLEVSDNKKIAHEITLPRSVYAKGFGREYPTSQLDIETYFEPYGPVNSVRMRRHADGNFKGSVFVEFADEQLATQFLNLETYSPFVRREKSKVQESDKQEETEEKEDKSELKVMSKKAYLDEKGLDAEQEADRPNNRRQFNQGGRGNKFGRGRGNARHNNRKGDNIDKDDWKKRRDNDQRSGRNAKKGRNGNNQEYRDVDVGDDANDAPATESSAPTDAAPADGSKKRARENGEADTSEVAVKKAKADGDD